MPNMYVKSHFVQTLLTNSSIWTTNVVGKNPQKS